MKCLMILLLLSIIRCQSINDMILTKNSQNNNNNSSSSSSSTPHYFHQQQQLPPLKMSFLFNESVLLVDESHIPQQTQPHQTSPKTTLSRIVETKYGKIQGLNVVLFSQQSSSEQQQQPTSNNNNNRIPHPLQNKIVEVFLSVPYASPPVKSNRFSPTQTPIPWEGVKQVIKPGFVCPQVMPEIRDEAAALKEMPKGYLNYLKRIEPYLRNQSEDCLYLNIFAPAFTGGTLQDFKFTRLKPVLVFIHGGKFSWGSGNLYDGTFLAAYTDILFITLNYRLGVLGFLNMNASPNAKPQVANFGLMDQIGALHWIKENIILFGGDPDNVTMMGYEAGAACIHFLMASPTVVPGLFHRAILIAGSSKAPWALTDDPFIVANSLADSLNCTIKTNNITTTSNLLLNFSIPTSFSSYSAAIQLLGKDRDSSILLDKTIISLITESLLDCFKNKHFSYFTKFLSPKFSADFAPSVDGVVILPELWTTVSDTQTQPTKRALNKKYEMLFGFSSSEMLYELGESDISFGVEPSRRGAILRTLVRNSYRFHLNEILATISNEYVDWERNIQHPVSARDYTLSALTDCLTLAPLIAATESIQIKRSYFYTFEHSTKNGLYSFQKTGGSNGEELNYFFGFPLVENMLPFFPSPFPSPLNYTKIEMGLSEMLLNYLSNFVHSGDPNEPSKGEPSWPISKEKNKYRNLIWEPYDSLHQKYLELTANRVRLRSHYRAHQMAVWLKLVPELERSGTQYASILHNQIKGGEDSSLYVGRLRLPEELALQHPHSTSSATDFDEHFYFNGTRIHPSPPSTCFSSLSSISSDIGHGGGAAVIAVEERKYNHNSSSMENHAQSPFTAALTVTITVGCSLLILNVFVFALLYYRRDKKRGVGEAAPPTASASVTTEPSFGGNTSSSILTTTTESQQLNSYGEPPELLKSNSTIATCSFHRSQSANSSGGTDDDQYDNRDHFHKQHFKNVNFISGSMSETEGRGNLMLSRTPQVVVVGVEEEDEKLVQQFCGDGDGRSSSNEQELLLSHQLHHHHHHHPVGVHFSYDTSTQQEQSHSKISQQQHRQSNHFQPHEQQQQLQQLRHNHSCQEVQLPQIHQQLDHVCVNLEPPNNMANQQQPLEISTLPTHSSFGVNGRTTASNTATAATLTRKPIPPTRNSSTSYTITQRQIFSVIMTLLTFGIF